MKSILVRLMLGLAVLGVIPSVQSAQADDSIYPVYSIVDRVRGNHEYYPSLDSATYAVNSHNANYIANGHAGPVALEAYIEYFVPNAGGVTFVILDTVQGTRAYFNDLYEALSAMNGHNANYSRENKPAPVILEGMIIPGYPGTRSIPSNYYPY